MAGKDYYFDGGVLGLLGIRVLTFFMVVLTLGLATPWALTWSYRWEAEHTVLDGRRLSFQGTGMGLLGHWIKWWFLTLITLGIYGFWVGIALKKWHTRNLVFQD